MQPKFAYFVKSVYNKAQALSSLKEHVHTTKVYRLAVLTIQSHVQRTKLKGILNGCMKILLQDKSIL